MCNPLIFIEEGDLSCLKTQLEPIIHQKYKTVFTIYYITYCGTMLMHKNIGLLNRILIKKSHQQLQQALKFLWNFVSFSLSGLMDSAHRIVIRKPYNRVPLDESMSTLKSALFLLVGCFITSSHIGDRQHVWYVYVHVSPGSVLKKLDVC